ncbi:retroviral-like aspartic protease family protein [Alteromonas lipolytica]|nr:retroviral-like aspartic protease family protein [Alteromonas lipolytica]GGF55313.1 hypothetical protein GCM10011338_04460 [Alteromonas lipolytica]
MWLTVIKRLFVVISVVSWTGLAEANSFALTSSAGGTLYLHSEADNVVTRYLIDTGSSLTILNKRTFALIRQAQTVTKAGKVIAKLANGRQQTVQLYTIPLLSLSKDCQFTDVSVAVMDNAHNILGMEVLGRAAPFGIELQPARLTLSQCDNTILAANQ